MCRHNGKDMFVIFLFIALVHLDYIQSPATGRTLCWTFFYKHFFQLGIDHENQIFTTIGRPCTGLR